MAFILLGVSLGAGLGYSVAKLLSRGRVELGLVPIGGIGVTICLMILSYGQLSTIPFLILVVAIAFFSGLFKRPLNQWIKEGVSPAQQNKVRWYKGMVSVGFVLLAMFISYAVHEVLGVFETVKMIAFLAALVTLVSLISLPAMLLRFVFLTIAHACYNIQITGRENVPKNSGALVISNHLSVMDSFLLVAAVPRMLRFVMMEQVYRIPVLKYIFKNMNMIPVGSTRDRVALDKFNRACAKEIQNGHVVCIFPEGQLSRIGQLLEFKKGMEHIAQESGAPIIPIYMDGVAGNGMAYHKEDGRFVFPKFRLRRRKVTLSIGAPMPSTTSAYEARNKMEELSVTAVKNRREVNQTLAQAFVAGVRKYPTHTIEFGEQKMTFKELGQRTINMAFFLKSKLEQHNRIALVANPSMDAAIVNYALTLLGKEVVNMDTQAQLETVRKRISKSKSTAVICNVPLSIKRVVQVKLSDCIVRNPASFRLTTALKKLENTQIATDICTVNIDDSEGDIFPSFTHQNVLSSIYGINELYHVSKRDKLLCTLPFWNASGLVIRLWAPLVLGGNVVEKKEHQPTILVGPQEDIGKLISRAKATEIAQIKCIITGSVALPQQIIHTIGKDVLISQSLALMPHNAIVSINRKDYVGKDLSGKGLTQPGGKQTSVGRAIPGVALKVFSMDQSKEAKPNEEGFIAVKSASISNQQLSNQHEEGWFISTVIGKKCKAGFITLSK